MFIVWMIYEHFVNIKMTYKKKNGIVHYLNKVIYSAITEVTKRKHTDTKINIYYPKQKCFLICKTVI